MRSTLLLVGALCLLGAGSVFALVTWMLLPWQARLVVMLGLAVGAVGAAAVLRRRDLPGSAETAGALAIGFHLIGVAVAAPRASEPRIVLTVGFAALCLVGWWVLRRGLAHGVQWRSADAAGALGLSGLGLLLSEQVHGHAPWLGALAVVGIPVVVAALVRRPALLRRSPATVGAACLVLVLVSFGTMGEAVDAMRAERVTGAALLVGWALPWLALVLLVGARTAAGRATPDGRSTGPGRSVVPGWSTVPGWARVGLALDVAAGIVLAGWWLSAARHLSLAGCAWTSLVVVAAVGLTGAAVMRLSGDGRSLLAMAPGLAVAASAVAPGLAVGLWRAARPVPEPGSLVWTWPASALALTAIVIVSGAFRGGRVDLPRLVGLSPATPVLAALVVPWCAHSAASSGGWATGWDAGWAAGWIPSVGAAVVAAVVVAGGALHARRSAPDPSAIVWWGAALALTRGDTEQLVAVLLVGAAGCAAWSAMRRRRALGMVATGQLLVACWLLLARADVTTPEAYTLVAACCLGAWALPETLTLRTPSMPAFPALVMALAPTTMMGVVDTTSVRALVGIVAAVALTALGAARRRAAHLYVGALAAGALALALCAPVVSLLPPWLPLAVGGAVLVALGVTWEARLAELRRVRSYAAALR
ncbi:SCO7613 C-terminal domain-containing membrane protein [Arsenicicoccus bolidensis]|uniref:SCO7613 C-terminal domain-containing membrane protein n=1 Tax=Arsenicicoccus bolidensis TaxID=229480 RepID=UPI0028B1F6BF|nr:hypothetical protein [Arsenicicoccus bolidensis]